MLEKLLVDAFPYVLGRPLNKFYLVSMLKSMMKKQSAVRTEPIEEMKLEVLVADDNKLCRNAVVSLLERHVSSVTVCDNGQKALQCLTAKHYDLALIDYQMPEMDGIETIRRLREYEKTHLMTKATFIICKH